MSKKMKGVALDSSPYVPYEDAKARFKHQTLIQDYQELQKETEMTRTKLETMKQRKLTLSAEVRFLQRRYKYLLKNKAGKPPQGQELVQQKIFKKQHKNTVKEKNYRRKEAPVFYANQKERIFGAKESARRNPSPVLDLNQKDRLHSGKETSLRNTTPVFYLNQKERTYGGKETTPRSPAPAFDLNQVERTCFGKENAVQNRAPIFDLNQISGEEELQNDYEALRMEEPKNFLGRGGTDEQLNDLRLSLCRNVGNGSNRTGKRKISWQDQVALQV